MNSTIKVVISDPSEDFCALLSETVSREPGVEVVGITGDGSQALKLCLELLPDVLITDLLLPGLDGLGLLRALQEHGVKPRTIVVSGFFNDAAASNLARIGVEWFFPKPCSISELVHRMTEVCDERTQFVSRSSNYDAEITDALLAFGVMPHLRGFRFLRAAVRMTIEDPGVLHGVTKILYPDIARLHSSSGKCVERSIRNAIEYAAHNGDSAKRLSHFGKYGEELSRRPTNSRCISLLAEFIRYSHLTRAAGYSGGIASRSAL